MAKRKRASAEDDKDQTDAIEINKHNRDYQSDEADFTLISSDGLHFRVKKMILMVASPVFSAMFEAGDSASGQLELTDPDIEDSSVLSSVLDLVYGKEIDVSWRGPANKSAPCIVLALQKYDCKNALTLIRLLIRNETLSRHNTGMWLFEAAVLLQDWETCHELIGDSGHWKFNGPFGGKDDVDEPRWGVMGAMNPVNWSTSRFERTPARVTRALLRGIEKGRNRSDDIDWEVVADEFKRILQDKPKST